MVELEEFDGFEALALGGGGPSLNFILSTTREDFKASKRGFYRYEWLQAAKSLAGGPPEVSRPCNSYLQRPLFDKDTLCAGASSGEVDNSNQY